MGVKRQSTALFIRDGVIAPPLRMDPAPIPAAQALPEEHVLLRACRTPVAQAGRTGVPSAG
jgi:hypothetical protein